MPLSFCLETGLKNCWDVVIIGAGPAGAMAAYETARRNFSVLLIDKARFPRNKVCGCCVSSRALKALKAAGLLQALEDLNPPRLSRFKLGFKKQSVDLPLQGGISVSREKLDMLLINQAVQAGAHFLPGVHAAVETCTKDYRLVRLNEAVRSTRIQARVILMGAGIQTEGLTGEASLQPRIAPDSRMGLGAKLEEAPSFYQPGTIYMAVGKEGYVGMVRVEDGSLNLAAALTPNSNFHPLLSRIIESAGFPQIPGLANVRWRGTPLLTRKPGKVASERVLLIGDSAGYAEPFTGEGIGWAIESGLAAASLVESAAPLWRPSLEKEWMNTYHRLVSRRQTLCRMLTLGLRQNFLLNLGMKILSHRPEFALPWSTF